MITVKLYARCGNQMFQIAACIGQAIKHGTDFKIPRTTIDSRVWKTYFNHLPELNGVYKISRVYLEKGHEYQEIPFIDNMCLDGFFQSEKYFSHCRPEIINAFNLDWKPLPIKYVSIHVRRGDYLRFADKHPPVSLIYLSKAIEFFNEKGFWNFIVFGDDPKWNQYWLNKKKFPGSEFDYSLGRSEIGDIEFMSSCAHHIIANSSFSWWGAWLNQNPDKIVVAPKTWFGPKNSHLNTKDLIPETWIKI